MQPPAPPSSIEELAAKLLGKVAELGTSLPRISELARSLRVKEEQIEDAFCYLVKSGFLARNFHHSGWSLAKHRSLRAKAPKPIQPCLFPREKKPRDEEYTQQAPTPAALYDTQKKQVEVRTGGEPPGRVIESVRGELEIDGWKISEWRPKKRHVRQNSTEVPAALILTLVRLTPVWQASETEEQGGGGVGGAA